MSNHLAPINSVPNPLISSVTSNQKLSNVSESKIAENKKILQAFLDQVKNHHLNFHFMLIILALA